MLVGRSTEVVRDFKLMEGFLMRTNKNNDDNNSNNNNITGTNALN